MVAAVRHPEQARLAAPGQPKTVAYAQHLITAEPLRLVAAVKAAEEARLAKQNARSFGEIVGAYRAYMQSEGKRYDKAASRINYIERTIGPRSGRNTVDLSDLRNLLASVAHLSKQTRRHYGSTFLDDEQREGGRHYQVTRARGCGSRSFRRSLCGAVTAIDLGDQLRGRERGMPTTMSSGIRKTAANAPEGCPLAVWSLAATRPIP